MKKLIFSSFMLCNAFMVYAQQTMKTSLYEVVAVSEETNIPSFILFNTSKPDPVHPESWFRDHLDANSDFALKEVRTTTDIAGNRHIRYAQYYKGIPVEGGIVNLHFKGNTNAHSMNGAYFPMLTADVAAIVKEGEALQSAKDIFPAGAVFAWERPSFERLLQKATGNQSATHFPKAAMVIVQKYGTEAKPVFRYAYRFDIYAVSPLSRKMIFVDALDGSILSSDELLVDVDVIGKAYTKYSGVQNITCDNPTFGIYTLEELGRGGGVATLNGKSVISGGSPESFEDYDNIWNNINPEQDEVATDLHWGLEKTYDYYKTVLGRKSIDDADHPLIGLAHIDDGTGAKMANAFWSGAYGFFGDGNDTSMYPLTALDVVGHEISHGLTQETAGLQYKDESGALNESFSDIFGKNVERFATPSTFSWEVGKAMMWPGKLPLRNMKNPPVKKHPKYYKGMHFYTGIDDNGGVHTNSGVQNFWYTLICDGGTGYRESDFATYEVKSIGYAKATQVAYSNLVNYLSPTSKYKDAAIGAVNAAKLLYGDTSLIVYNVQMAWYAVGLMEKPKEPEKPSSVLSQNILSGLQLYPNPTKTSVNILNPQGFEHTSLRVLNLMGQEIRVSQTIGKTIAEIDLSAQPAGLYLLEIEQDGQLRREKVIKQ